MEALCYWKCWRLSAVCKENWSYSEFAENILILSLHICSCANTVWQKELNQFRKLLTNIVLFPGPSRRLAPVIKCRRFRFFNVTLLGSLRLGVLAGSMKWSAWKGARLIGISWSEFPDRPCDDIVRLITKKTNIWSWSALLSSALGDKFAGCQLCWDNYSSERLNTERLTRPFFRGMDECFHAFIVLSLPTASLDVTSLYCCRGHYIT